LLSVKKEKNKLLLIEKGEKKNLELGPEDKWFPKERYRLQKFQSL